MFYLSFRLTVLAIYSGFYLFVFLFDFFSIYALILSFYFYLYSWFCGRFPFISLFRVKRAGGSFFLRVFILFFLCSTLETSVYCSDEVD